MGRLDDLDVTQRPNLAVLDDDGAVGETFAEQLVEHAGHADRGLAGPHHEHPAPREVEGLLAGVQGVAVAAQQRAQSTFRVDGGEGGGGDRQGVAPQLLAAMAGQLVAVDEPAGERGDWAAGT
jgi:hypothetical protein